ncbi:MAG: winged helix-turn-helix domain-containing protein, partial [Thermoproteota archaeon]
KNKRRVRLARILIDGPKNLGELQQRLKMEGYYHSKETIAKHYALPMEEAGILVWEGGSCRLTEAGRAVVDSLGEADLGALFPKGSKCYEEACLIALEKNRSYKELLDMIPRADLQRTVRRLAAKGPVAKLKPDRHATYRLAASGEGARLSVTEEKVLGSISSEGSGVNEISRKAGISVRRTFKYLKRLRERGLVSCSQGLVILSLTEEGKKIAAKILQVLDAARIEPRLDRTRGEAPLEPFGSAGERKTDLAVPKVDFSPKAGRGRFKTKRDVNEKQFYELVLASGEGGVAQASVGKLLRLPSREVSRIASRLESWKLIRREKIVYGGRNTFRIVSTRKPPSMCSILGAPCITCPNANRCEGADEGASRWEVSPEECPLLERWIMGAE